MRRSAAGDARPLDRDDFGQNQHIDRSKDRFLRRNRDETFEGFETEFSKTPAKTPANVLAKTHPALAVLKGPDGGWRDQGAVGDRRCDMQGGGGLGELDGIQQGVGSVQPGGQRPDEGIASAMA